MFPTLSQELEKKVQQTKLDIEKQEKIVEDAYKILRQEHGETQQFLQARGVQFRVPPEREKLVMEGQVTTDYIRELAVKYRMRYVPIGRFRGRVPAALAQQMKAFEERKETTDVGQVDYYILAPKSMLFLDEVQDTDPIVFAAEMEYNGNGRGRDVFTGRHFIVHRWGSDMSFLRKVLVLPMRDPLTIIYTTVVLTLAAWFFGYHYMMQDTIGVRMTERMYNLHNQDAWAYSVLCFAAPMFAACVAFFQYHQSSERVWNITTERVENVNN